MAISTDIAGKEFGPFIRSYDFRDLEICALGCNAAYDGITDLEYVNYGYGYSGSLHYGFELRMHAPFKMSDRIETFVTQDALYDRGVGRGRLSKYGIFEWN